MTTHLKTDVNDLMKHEPQFSQIFTFVHPKMNQTLMKTNLIFTCSKSTIDALENGVKYVQS